MIGAFFSALDDAPGAAPQMRAGLGARVTIRRGVLLSKVIIVAEDEADPARGRIASTAPLGCALEGARRGDVIELEAGGRTEQVHVFAVERGEG